MTPGLVRDGLAIADEVRRRVRRGATLREDLTIKGTCHVQLFDENGELKEERRVDNLVVSAGRDAIIERLDSSPATSQPTHMAVGTGSTAPAAGNTTLGAEIDRNALTSNTASGGVLTMVGNWAAGDATNSAIAEAGVFNAASSGTLYSRATFTAINKGASDTLQITWTYTLTPS
jgi:hypothetical protein